MPFGLGFFATAGGAAPVAVGDYDLLTTTVLGTATASVTFSNLGDYSSTYKHLQIRAVVRGAGSFTSVRTELEINGSATGYASHELSGNGSSVASSAWSSESFTRPGRVIASSSTASSFTAQVIDILDAYSTNKNKTIRALGGSTGYNYVYLTSGLWANTNSITSILLRPESGTGNWAQYSRFSLYGLKG